MIRTWKITGNGQEEIEFTDRSSLDAITKQLPDGYYSTFRTFDGGRRVLGLTAHLNRLPDVEASLLRRSLDRCLEPFRPEEARVRVIQTRRREVYIAVEPLKTLPREVYEKGVRVVTTEIRRISPRTKSTAFIGQSDEERKNIAQKGVFEALLVKNGRILEGITSNFFYFFGDVLHTARRDVLLGVTRRTVIRVARGRGVEVRYSALKLDRLAEVSEAFITSSSRGIVPVVQIDEVKVGEGRVGEATKDLSVAYEVYVLRKAERI